MKTLTALFTAAALTLTAGLTHADDDVRPEHIPQLVKEGKILPMEQLKQEVEKLHPGATHGLPELDKRFNGYEYEVEVRYPDGREYEVELNAATGGVLKNELDKKD
ncbi:MULTISPECIES: PepSY domain-containing protein [unclassified Pseudomonas]|uniref:PepSY domain-containing protein n=1 Tax=unclassified Pseudomonas TaxID=196821 RepID=UPI00119C7C82|nr:MULTISPECIES: PepSY domain-containing protein [unclassified Pseudomonas]TWC20600.1 peptidase YpeB-like protein [Pseudomonas sp. SJZ075]TWC25518.1 peptidase YpeB-like protein [Pseudomonas sp. SJZ074]TWC36030.1 peptidase YpeB-like protein [Pseudomonas sp. SJZ078]TWC42329.1 peptidase YpeB-like protein [Pseudomonas sp. SJZ085]TWC56898.1 peptidase YpeB-like protein [Pseudomonas sp. SJZ124]